MICAIIGDAPVTKQLEKQLEREIKDFIDSYLESHFIIGYNTDFEKTAIELVECSMLRSYRVYMNIISTEPLPLRKVIVPEPMDLIRDDAKIIWRNRWMKEKADMLIEAREGTKPVIKVTPLSKCIK